MKSGRALEDFAQATQSWFRKSFANPSPVQIAGWPHLRAGKHALLLAPTGSGKTLAAFLSCIDSLLHRPKPERPGFRVLYISPLKSLAYDIDKNLRVPLNGITELSPTPLSEISVDIRTGDTSASMRQKQARNPGDILITTPESLYLLLGSKAREGLRTIETVIIDEIHAVSGTKRGVHLFLSLERLDILCNREVQRIGLSATQRPLDRIANLLGGDRKVEIVDCQSPPLLDLQIEMPPEVLPDEDAAPQPVDAKPNKGMWPAILPRLLQSIQSHTTTLVFCNSRRLAERIAQELNDLAGEDICKAHHGSVARSLRVSTEEALKRGQLRSLVATSSMELGIDVSSIDLVVQIGSPSSVSQGLQRVGRAGHSLGIRSQGLIIPKFRGDLLEATAIAQGMRLGHIEECTVPENCLDVLAQQIVAMVSAEDRNVAQLLATIRRAYSFRNLSIEAYYAVLDMLSGRYTESEMPQLRPRITWDRQEDRLMARKGSKMISLINGGTIPDRGLYAVHLGQGGPRIGELDEEMVYEARAGECFLLGASTWRILEITRDQVIVSPAPGESGKMPFWRGEGPGRPASLGQKLGAIARELSALDDHECKTRLIEEYLLSPDAADHLHAYLRTQQQASGVIPSDQCIVVERFCDEVGDWRVCILSPFGSRVHAPWSMAISAKLSEHGIENPQMHWTDDGIALHLPDTGRELDLSLLLPSCEELQELIVSALAGSALFATRFRENAARALLLPKQRPGKRTPLWLQRLKSQQLLDATKSIPGFPIGMETYRECMLDVFDLPALENLLKQIHDTSIAIHSVETTSPSPFARGLVYSFVAAYLYEGDAPSAERKAAVLNLDRALLRDLLGSEDLREFIELEVVELVDEELQFLSEDRLVRNADELHDMLRSLGNLSEHAITERSSNDPQPWLASLASSGRACLLQLSGPLWVATENAAAYRDALGVTLPEGIPVSLLETVPDAIYDICLRYAARRKPFTETELAQEFGLELPKAREILSELENRGRILRGNFTPGKTCEEWCNGDVLRRIRKRSLARLRAQIAPVSGAQYTNFLCEHHGINAPGQGLPALRTAIDMLAAQPLPWSEIESRILPSRISNYHPSMLDALCASGEVLWVGAGSLGKSDGKVRLVLRHKAHALLPACEELGPDAPALATSIDQELQSRGASFLAALALNSDLGDSEEIESALGYLLWNGRITNDTVAYLRGLKTRPRRESAKRKVRMQRIAGRWSSSVELALEEKSAADILLRSQALLDCFAVVSRELGPCIGGNYSSLASVYRLMEDQGKLRRGLFVDGLEGVQYCRAGVVDSLRTPPAQVGQVLAACDPASPWGNTLGWPAHLGSVSRRAGSTLYLWQGHPICYVESGRTKLVTFGRDERLDKVITHLLPAMAAKRSARITTIDGEAAALSPLCPRFITHQWRIEQESIVLERYR